MRILPRDEQFFELLIRQGELLVQATSRLRDAFRTGSPDWDAACRDLAKLEQQGDDIVRETIQRLSETFLTPFDAEDLYRLALDLDRALDIVEGLMQRVRVFGIDSVPGSMTRITDLLTEAAGALYGALTKLSGKTPIDEDLRIVQARESAVDEVYRQALHDLFRSGADAVALITQKDLYERLEKAADQMQDTSYVLEEIRLKNA